MIFEPGPTPRDIRITFSGLTENLDVTATYQYTHDPNQDLCVYEMHCHVEAPVVPITFFGTFDPAFDALLYDSEVQYSCPNMTSFIYNGMPYDFFNYTCLDGAWDPPVPLPPCECKHEL